MQCSLADGWRVRARPCFGTLLVIRVRGLPTETADETLTSSFALAEGFHVAMSRQSAQSDLAALRSLAPGETLQLRRETRAVLDFALSVAAQTEGRFDPVVPAARGRAATWRDVCLLPEGDLSVCRPLELSLDGVAKGFAADRICELLRERGASDVIVDAGGDLALSCSDSQPVGIRDPRRPGRLARVIGCARGGIASSGSYGGISELWGREGRAHGWPRAVSIVARNCATADALTKVAATNGDTSALLARFGAEEVRLA